MSAEQNSQVIPQPLCTPQPSQCIATQPQVPHVEPTPDIKSLPSESRMPIPKSSPTLPSEPSSAFEEQALPLKPKSPPSELPPSVTQVLPQRHIGLRCRTNVEQQRAGFRSIAVGPDHPNPFIFPNCGQEHAGCARQRDAQANSCSGARVQHNRRKKASSHSLIFPERIRTIPTVRILRKVYSNIRGSNTLLGCLVAAAEVATLAAGAPAAAAWHLLPFVAATPLHVADLLLCKGLDMVERVLPCLKQTPMQACEGVVACACGVPLGLAYVACKGCCVGARVCVCDAPAACVGAPALVACALAELALCDAPAALCRLPARLTAAAARQAASDAGAWLRALDVCAERFLKVFRDEDDEDGGDVLEE